MMGLLSFLRRFGSGLLRWLLGRVRGVFVLVFASTQPEPGQERRAEAEAEADTDHISLREDTVYRSYGTSFARYPRIRTLYRPHAHAGKLRAIADLPLVVVVHGLGGTLPQFAPLLGSLVAAAPVFGIELPGHGLSAFAPTEAAAYTFEALVELWKVAVEEVCRRQGHRRVVLVAHSMGCSIAAALVSAAAGDRRGLEVEVGGVVAICPKAGPPTQSETARYRRLLSLPDFVLDLLRWFDRRGQEDSASVRRFVGDAAGPDLRRLQLRFNRQFKTPVWKRVSLGLLPSYDAAGHPVGGGLPGRAIWEGVKVPLLLIAGEADGVTKAREVVDILAFVQGKPTAAAVTSTSTSTAGQPLPAATSQSSGTDMRASDDGYGIQPSTVEAETQYLVPVKFVVLPAPASHALMYDHATYRTVAGLIEDFLARHVSHELSLGWQLQQLTTSGKWDVKNLEKWKKVLPVSGPMGGGLFRALKTLRQQDDVHTPSVFLQRWSRHIFAVIDISHESPVYDTKALERGGVQYHKFPTVSKIPPTLVEVHDFIALVDRLRSEMDEKYPAGESRPAIAVHCHYGYNRTGFFIICYLIEKCQYRVQDAIEEFAEAKPPGIKHDHFIDTLFMRYSVGLRKSSTFR